MARVYYSTAAVSRNTTTSTTPQDQATLTFTPNASKVYVLLWGCLLDNSSTTNDSLARLYNSTDAAALQTFNFEAQDTTDNFQVAGAAIYTAPGSPTSMDFKVQYYSESTNTTGCQDAYLIALELDAADFQSVTTAEQSTSSSTPSDIGPTVTVGAGDFLLIASSETKQAFSSGSGDKWYIALGDGTEVIAQQGDAYGQDTTNYSPMWLLYRVSPGSSTTYKMRFVSPGAADIRARNTTLVALDLAQFSDVIYGDSITESTTTSSTAQTKLSVTDTPLAQDYLQLFSALRRHNATTTSAYTDYTRGGSAISVEAEREPNDIGERLAHGYGVISALTAVSTTWGVRYRTETSTLTRIENAAFAALGLGDAVTSYTIEASAGSFTLTGNDAGLLAGRAISAAAGEFILTGNGAGLIADRTMAADAGAFTFTGNDAGLLTGRAVAADTGAFTLTGNDATFSLARHLIAGSGAFSLFGNDVGLTAQRLIDAGAGTFDLTGQDVALLVGRKLAAELGSFILTGQDADLIAARLMDAEQGAFVLTGLEAELIYSGSSTYTLDAETGAFTLTGNDVHLLHGRVLRCDAGSFVLTGNPVDLVYSAAAAGGNDFIIRVRRRRG